MVTVAKERVRIRHRYVNRGEAYYHGTGVRIAGDRDETNIETWKATDWVRPKSDPKCYPLEIYHWLARGGQLNKSYKDGNDSHFVNFIPEIYSTQSNFPHPTSFLGQPSYSQAATIAAAQTNPSRPYVDVPVFVLELGDIVQLVKDTGTRLIRDAGKRALKRGSAANLNLQFGLLPLIDDFAKLANFAQAFSIRMKEVDRLFSKNGLRRTVKIGRYTKSGVYHHTLQSQGVLKGADISWHSTRAVSAHCRWKPKGSQAVYSRGDLEWLTKKTLHGLTADSLTLWEGLPFTWLIDYCTTIGKYFQAKRNLIPAELRSCHIMEHTTTHFWIPGIRTSTYSFNQGYVLRDSKWRTEALVSPTVHLPFLSANQVGILTSLLGVRIR